MLNGREEEEFVTDDPSAAVGEVRIQIDVGSWLGRREQLRTGGEWCSPKDKPTVSVVVVGSRLCDRVENRTHGVAEFRRVVLRALAKQPADRYPSAEELAADLRELPGEAVAAAPPEDAAPKILVVEDEDDLRRGTR